MADRDLRDFLDKLEAAGQLKRIGAEVDALDEMIPPKWPTMRRREVPIAPQ